MAYEYTKEIKEAGIENVVPSYAPFSEAYFYLQEATENDWSNLMKKIGIYELGVYEATGQSVVYEADDEAAPKNKVAEFFAGVWARIKGLYDKAIKAIQDACKAAKEKFKSVRGLRLEEKEFKEGTKFGKYRDYSYLEKIDVENFDGADHKIVESKEFDTDAAFVKEHWGELVDIAFDFKFTKGQIVKNYTATKKAFDEAVKAAKAGGDKEALSSAKQKATNLNKYASQVCRLFHERQRRALAIVAKVTVSTMGKSNTEKNEDALKKEQKAQEKELLKNAGGKKEEKTNESAPVVESYSSEIGKLFDWDF